MAGIRQLSKLLPEVLYRLITIGHARRSSPLEYPEQFPRPGLHRQLAGKLGDRLARELSGRAACDRRVDRLGQRIDVRRRRQLFRQFADSGIRVVLRWCINIGSDASDFNVVIHRHFRDPEISDFHDAPISGQQEVVRFDVPVNHVERMGIGERASDLLKVKQRLIEREPALATKGEHVSTRHEFQNEVVECCAHKVGGRSMPQPLDYIRMPDFVERHSLVLKVLYQGPLKVSVDCSLQGSVESFDDDCFAPALTIVGEEDLRIAAASQAGLDLIAIIDDAALQL